MIKKVVLTQKEYDLLEDMLRKKETRGEKLLVERYENYKEGDPRENDGYLLAEDLLEDNLYDRLELKGKLDSATIIDVKADNIVAQGKVAKVEIDGKTASYVCCSSLLANPFKNWLSIESPLGAVLLGRSKGEKFVVEMGNRERHIKILDVKAL